MTALTERDLTPEPKLPWQCSVVGCNSARLSTSTRCMSCIQNASKAERNALKAASKPAPAPLKRSTRIAKKSDPESLAGLKLEAQKVFNAFIRERDKDKLCIYCSLPVSSQDLEACHFYPVSTSEYTRYDEFNVFGGHRLCNQNDDREQMAANVLKRIGINELNRLEKTNFIFAKFSTETLEMIIENYTKPKETI